MTPDDEASLKVVEEILMGRHNGHLPDIIGAARMVDGGNRVQWRFDIDGLPEITTQNVTLFELERLERISGVLWETFVGQPLLSMRLVAALFTAVLIEREGCDEKTAKDRLSAVTGDQIVSGFSHYEADSVPLVLPAPDSGTST